MIKIYSHPRSGTHFLEAFLAKNFYPDLDLSVSNEQWGHWSNRQHDYSDPHGKLFAHHHFPRRKLCLTTHPKIYIYRDGRAVALSIWKTNNFLHKELENISFSEFLRHKIDWYGSPAIRSAPKMNIIEHWHAHVKTWYKIKAFNLLHIRYEDLLLHPDETYKKIKTKLFFLNSHKKISDHVEIIKDPVGLLPNTAKADQWKKYFSEEDLEFFHNIVPCSSPFLFNFNM